MKDLAMLGGKVYRVEHKRDGFGPYQLLDTRSDRSSNMTLSLSSRHSGCPYHPTPFASGYAMKAGEVCGFDSVNQLCEWFTEDETIQLEDNGFLIRVYDVPSGAVSHHSDFQVVFQRELSTFVLDIPLWEVNVKTEVHVFEIHPDGSERVIAHTKFRNGSEEKTRLFLEKHSMKTELECYAEYREEGIKGYVYLKQ